MAERTQAQFIADEWEKSGGANPLGEYSSFHDALFAAFDKGERPYNVPGVPAIAICMDEGIGIDDIKRDLHADTSSVIRTAGSGILAGKRQREIFHYKKEAIFGIASHGECGAAGIYAQKHELIGDTDIIGKEAAEQIAEKLGKDYLGKITPTKRPSGLHTARTLYYDGTQQGFETSKLSTLPLGFGISRGFGGREAGMSDARLAAEIAMGENGFGEKFTSETPFHLVGITDTKEGSIPPAMLKGELEEIRNSSSMEVVLITINRTI